MAASAPNVTTWTKPSKVEVRRVVPQAFAAQVLLDGLRVSDDGKTISVADDDVLAAVCRNQAAVVRLLFLVHTHIVPHIPRHMSPTHGRTRSEDT